jgi:hypothetical protein
VCTAPQEAVFDLCNQQYNRLFIYPSSSDFPVGRNLEHNNEALGFIKGGELLGQQSYC